MNEKSEEYVLKVAEARPRNIGRGIARIGVTPANV